MKASERQAHERTLGLRVSYAKHGHGLWIGVLRDEKGGIVWRCPHVHTNRDLPRILGRYREPAAQGCARAELDRRIRVLHVNQVAGFKLPGGWVAIEDRGEKVVRGGSPRATVSFRMPPWEGGVFGVGQACECGEGDGFGLRDEKGGHVVDCLACRKSYRVRWFSEGGGA